MSFSADWLALRAAADRRARNPSLAAALARTVAGRGAIRILDLGAGTGATMHALAPLLPGPQLWVLADADPSLLARAVPPEGARIQTLAADFAAGIDLLLAAAPDLVTASAFFDLAGRDWIDRLVMALAARRLPLLAALSYTGTEIWEPAHPLDASVRAAFHADQRRDKGLGPALGPGAHRHLVRRLRATGYAVIEGPSDWVLEQPRDGALIADLARGTAAAVAPRLGTEAETWRGAREGATRVRVSHGDLLALPPPF